MRDLLQVFAYELRRNFRRKGYLFTTFGVPLLALVAMFAFQRFSQSANTDDALVETMRQVEESAVDDAGYVDETGLFGSDTLSEQLAGILMPYPDEAAARAALDAGEIDVYYIVPADYMATGDVRLVMPRLNISGIGTEPIRELILNTLTEGQDPEIVNRILNPSNLTQTNLTLTQGADTSTSEDSTFIVIYVFAIALMLGLFVTNGYLMQSVIEEKETRLIEILIATIRPIQLLGGKILAMGLLGLLQITAWIGGILLAVRLVGGDQTMATLGMLGAIANIRVPTEVLPLLLIYFILAYALFAALYAVIGALSNSMREGPQYAALLTLPTALPLYFLPVFASAPDGVLPTILSIIPLTSPLAMTERLLISTVPSWQIALSLVLLALAVVFVMWLAGRVFRVQTLLAGQGFRLPRLRRG